MSDKQCAKQKADFLLGDYLYSLLLLLTLRENNHVGRRQDAEEGQPHRTARRLGALFEDLIPDSPRLIESFGTRVSQVVQTPGISPSGSGIDGPFEPYVGADGTTLWAAATSGVASIGVYLLSCLLARAWDAKPATAIWVELIKQRKQEIEQAYAENKDCGRSHSLRGAAGNLAR